MYIEYYDETPADITVEVDTAGAVESVGYSVDLSGIFASLFEHADELGLDLPAGALKEAQDAFADTEFTIDSIIRFEIVDDLEVEPPPATTDDRTEEWLEFLDTAGL